MLTELVLDGNQLDVPAEIATSLERLNLGNNQLTGLPQTGQLTSLVGCASARIG